MLLSRGTVSTSKLFLKYPAFKFVPRGHYSPPGWFSLLLGVNFEILVLFEMCGWLRREGCIGSWWGNRGGKRPLGRPRHRWMDNIRTDLQEVGCGYMDWNGLAQDRDRWQTLVSRVMNLWVP